MLKVGITGGIGSGKSTVCSVFRFLGIAVYEADSRAKWLMEHDAVICTGLTNWLGEDIYSDEGRLDRQRLAKLIFNDSSALARVNALVHPRVAVDFEAWAAEKEANGSEYVLKEAAILFESGSHMVLDTNIAVVAPQALRVARVMARDAASEEQVLARIRNQWSDEQRLALAEFTIRNDECELVLPQVLDLHQLLLGRAAESA